MFLQCDAQWMHQDIRNLIRNDSVNFQIQKAITKIEPLGGSTNTSEALEKVTKICEHRHNTRNPLIVILITDGHSDNKARAIQNAMTLRQKWGAHFFAVGVGSAVNQTELSNLASSKDNVLFVDSYRALKNVREKVAVKACSGTMFTQSWTHVCQSFSQIWIKSV